MAGACSAPQPSRTVVVGVNWLGDTIMSLAALVALRQWLPQEDIHLVCPGPLAEVVRMAQVADRVWGWPQGTSSWQRVRLLRQIGAQRVILFPNSFRAALLTCWARVPERWGYAGRWRRFLLNRCVPGTRRPKGAHHSELYLELLRAMGWNGHVPAVQLSVPMGARFWARELIDEERAERPLIGICPGAAYGPAKKWPPERFVDAACRLRDSHGGTLVIMGSQGERESISSMAREMGAGVLNLAGKTDLPGLAAILAECQVVLCNDSGPMHLAAALGVPVVAVFGSTDPLVTAPLGPHRIVSAGLACSPCLRRRCPEGHYQCLINVRVEEVVKAAEGFLEREASGR